jgi:hypothetical protein
MGALVQNPANFIGGSVVSSFSIRRLPIPASGALVSGEEPAQSTTWDVRRNCAPEQTKAAVAAANGDAQEGETQPSEAQANKGNYLLDRPSLTR